jgi:hypothetical protein
MSTEKRLNKRLAFLTVVLVVGLWLIHWCLGTFYTRFEDMRQQGLRVQLPDGYTLVSTTQSHPNPAFFSASPEVESIYRTNRPLATACDDLRQVVMNMGDLKGSTQAPTACGFGTVVSAGWTARLLGGWNYTLGLGAVEESGLVTVHVTVRD